MPIAGRSIKITQKPYLRAPPGAREQTADLCWKYVCLISEWTGRKLSPAAVLDHLLWGGTVYTEKFTYSIEGDI